MARLSKCKGCMKMITPSEKFVFSNKSYCKTCYDVRVKENEDYSKLVGWVCDYFNQEKPSGLILKQIKEFKEQFGYTYNGMGYCLWYLTEIKGFTLQSKYGITLVKFWYDQAKDYFLKQEMIQKSVPTSKPIEVIRNVKIKPKRKLNSKLLMDIDELLLEKGDI